MGAWYPEGITARATGDAVVRTAAHSKASDAGRVTAQALVRAPTVAKASDAGRAEAQAVTRPATHSKATTATARGVATAGVRVPDVDLGGFPPQFVDVGPPCTAAAVVRRPSVDAVLGRAVASGVVLGALPAVYGRSRAGSAGWRSWRRL